MSEPPPSAPPARGAYLRLVLLGAAVGIPAALVGAGFLGFVHELEGWLWKVLPGQAGTEPAYLVLGLPVAGAVIVVLARRLLPGDGGHRPLQGLSGGITPISHAPGVALAAIGTLAFGAVLGPEAPVIALGSVVGVVAARAARLDERATTVIGTAGSFSAISALFGGPLVAGMLLVEGGLSMGARLLPVLLPGLVSAGIGYLIFVGLGDWAGLDAPGLVVPQLPPYEGTHVLDLLVGVVVGVVTALIIAGVRRSAARLESEGTRRLGMPALLIGGGLAVGLLALLSDALGGTAQDVLFSGQASVPVEVTATTTQFVLVVLACKTVAYAVSLGCGFRGGPIFPAVFVGVGVASLPVVWFDVSPTLAVAVGAAAGMAAQARLLFAPLLFADLLVGQEGLDATPAAVLAAVAAWLSMAALEPRAEDQ